MDLNHHLQAASKAFFANKTILCDRNVHVKDRLRYFDAVVSPVALFGSGHRTVHQKDLHQLDAACRKFLRAVVGPPSNLDWSRPWHEILHDWSHTAGCPRHNWVTKLAVFARFLQMDEWQTVAQDTTLWLQLTEDFIQFCRH